jgi:hypothetical protein
LADEPAESGLYGPGSSCERCDPSRHGIEDPATDRASWGRRRGRRPEAR